MVRRSDWLFFFGNAAVNVICYMLPWLISLTHPTVFSCVVGALWCAGWPALLTKMYLRQRDRC